MTSFFENLINTFPAFMEAAWMTLRLTGVSLVLALVIGLVFALMKSQVFAGWLWSTTVTWALSGARH